MGSRERKKVATHQAMVDAAARLFAERGVEATTMEDIARAAGTSRTSVFNYFGYKEMILCEIGARYVAQIAGAAGVVPRRSPRQRLYDMVDIVAQLTQREPELLAAIAREMTHPDPDRRRMAAETMQYGTMVETTLDLLEATGRLRAPERRSTYARLVIDMVAGTIIRSGGDFPAARLRTELRHGADLFLDGALKPS